MFIILLLIRDCLAECHVKIPEAKIFVTPDETIKLNLQDFIYGKSIKYHSNLPENELCQCLNEKMETSTVQYIDSPLIDWDLEQNFVTSQCIFIKLFLVLHKAVGLVKRTKKLQLNLTYELRVFNVQNNYISGGSLVDLRILQKDYDCMKVAYVGHNTTLISCSRTNSFRDQYFFIYDLTTQQLKYAVPSIFQTSNAIFDAYLSGDNEEFIDVFYIAEPDGEECVYQARINTETLEVEGRIFLGLDEVKGLNGVYQLQFHNHYVYTLVQNEDSGVFVKQTLDGYRLNTWILDTTFKRFSIYTESSGLTSVIFGSEGMIVKYQLMDSGLAILQEYGTPYFAAIYQLAHNYKFSLLHARNQNQQDLLWIFEDDNRLEQNLFGDIDLKSTQISAFRFDQINNVLLGMSSKKTQLIKLQDPVMTINTACCHPDNMEDQITIHGFSLNDSCTSKINLQEVEQDDVKVYEHANPINAKVIITKDSINKFTNLKQFYHGANLEYYTNPERGSLRYFLFKNSSVMNLNRSEFDILFQGVAYKLSGNMEFYHIVQRKDPPDYSLVINLCTIGNTQSSINCTLQSNTIIQQPISVITIQSYSTNLGLAYSTPDNVVTILSTVNQNFTFFANFTGGIGCLQFFTDSLIYMCGNNQIDLYRIQNKSLTLIQSITVELLNRLSGQANNVSLIYGLRSQLFDRFLYISTDVAIIVLDNGLSRFGEINLVSAYYFDQKPPQYQTILLNQYVLVYYSQFFYVINFRNILSPYFEKRLQRYKYQYINPIIYTIGQNTSFFYVLARSEIDSKLYYLVYSLHDHQLNCLFTSIQVDNTYPAASVSQVGAEYLLYVAKMKSEWQTTRLYKDVEFVFSQKEAQDIQIQYIGMEGETKQNNLKILVQDSDKQLDINISDPLKANESLVYASSKDVSIDLSDFSSFIDGSVSRWSMDCKSCPDELSLVNYIDFGTKVANLPLINQIKRSTDYVFIQQTSMLTVINSDGVLKYIISLPITSTDPVMQCMTLASNFDVHGKTKLVISVCTGNTDTLFYITSFLSSQPFSMGPFTIEIFIHKVQHARLIDEFLFLLDSLTDIVYLFETDLDNSSQQFKLSEYMNAKDFTNDDEQKFINFDAATFNQKLKIYVLFLITDKSYLIVNVIEKNLSFNAQYKIQEIVQRELVEGEDDMYPTNVNPSNIIVFPKTSDSPTPPPIDFQKRVYGLIIVNENYHHFEFELTINRTDTDGMIQYWSDAKLVRTYLQYGCYQANEVYGKSRVSDPDDGFFGVVYVDPIQTMKRVLVIYNTLDTPQQGNLEERIILGGYPIDTDPSILFDFVRQKTKAGSLQQEKVDHGMIMINGTQVTLLKLSRTLQIRVLDKQFKNQLLNFTGSNDFGRTVSFEKNLFNKVGQMSNLLLWLILGGLCIGVVLLALFIIIKQKKNMAAQKTKVDILNEEKEVVVSQQLEPADSQHNYNQL